MSKKITVLSNLWLVAALAAVVVAAPFGSASAASLPSAQEIIDNYIKAIGGKAAIGKINNRVTKGVFSLVDMGMTANYENIVAPPNAYNAISIEGMGEVLNGISDGVAWESHFMNGDSILEGDRKLTAERGATLNQYVDWQKWYSSAEVKGEEAVGESTAYAVEMTPKSGDPSTVYFDKESGLIVQTDGVGQDGMMASTIIGDYKDVNGVKVPHSIRIEGGMTIEITMESIEHNAEIADDAFALPAQIAALANPEAAEDEGSTSK